MYEDVGVDGMDMGVRVDAGGGREAAGTVVTTETTGFVDVEGDDDEGRALLRASDLESADMAMGLGGGKGTDFD
jgi:hypothetical protein